MFLYPGEIKFNQTLGSKSGYKLLYLNVEHRDY
jgi:hypothetical protein